jgi:hypothetical protein
VRVTPWVTRGSAFVPYNQPGLAAGTLLSGTFHAVARVEAAGTAETGDAAPAAATVGSEA